MSAYICLPSAQIASSNGFLVYAHVSMALFSASSSPPPPPPPARFFIVAVVVSSSSLRAVPCVHKVYSIQYVLYVLSCRCRSVPTLVVVVASAYMLQQAGQRRRQCCAVHNSTHASQHDARIDHKEHTVKYYRHIVVHTNKTERIKRSARARAYHPVARHGRTE